ncbi:MAG: penicillin-binding protein [Actinobacteria bacterium]|nr:penicillin-binding protein [Actinomycetota bacterium]
MDYATRRSRRQSTRPASKIFLASKITHFVFYGLIGLILLTIGLFLWYGRDLPTPGKLSQLNLPQSTRILDRKGIVLYDIYSDQNRSYVELDKIPKYLQQGTIAIEDKDFYKNDGFSIIGYLRSVRNILFFQGITGGSTLTQQLVKQTLLTSERSLPRKIKELILAIQVDKKYTKKQILELYLNVAPYGGTNVGVETASENYFGKKVQELSLIESAILAGMPQRPSYFSPYGNHPKAYISRTTDVLRRMREDGYITKEQEKNAVNELPNVKFLSRRQSIKAPHFSFYVKEQLIKQFGESMVESGGLQVTTTLDYKLQEKSEDIVKQEVDSAVGLRVGNGASVVINPKNGEILSMVGSKDFFAEETSGGKGKVPFEGQFNVITQGLRQPGSSIKPITYATALSKGYTASTLIMDTKTVFPDQGGKDYIPVNYDGKYHGPIQMRFALGNSFNVPAVKMVALVGLKSVLQTAYDMGISTLAPTSENQSKFGLSLTLGGGEVIPLEEAVAYSAFANGGYKVQPVSILKVVDRKGNVLYEHKEQNSKEQVIKPEIAFIISHILLDNNARLTTFGSNSLINISSRQVAVKTGTTDDKRDNWVIGWTPNLLVASWVGNNDNSPMGSIASGATGASPIWRRIMLEALKNRPVEDFKKPDNVEAVNIDAMAGGLPYDNRPTRSEYFIKGTEPQTSSPVYKSKDGKKYYVFSEKDPVSTDGKNRWQEGIDQWIAENHKDDEAYHPPSELSSSDSSSSNNEDPTDTPSPTQEP